ncbi:MAG: FeoB-associated Cys-rich membrane protein [Candidatus Kuenenia sp.]|nr:FeoB-associated Cys-rich membrane protein [Candidatus Kuenenia hertensis]
MELADKLLMGFIICGAIYILYRSARKEKEQCKKCSKEICRENEPDSGQ